MKNKHILIGVTGSIAAYKAAEIVRAFKKKNWEVTVVMTRAATEFVSELTFRTLSGNRVYVEMFDKDADWCPEHISLSDRADLFLIAPCTANVIAKMAHGMADDLLTATALACDAPTIVAPAMNSVMWKNEVTQQNIKILSDRGFEMLDTDVGDLACGYEGEGRLMSVDKIVTKALKLLG